MLETVTISLDHYMELVNIQFKVEELQKRLDKEILLCDEICRTLGLEQNYYNKVKEKEGEQ